MMKKTFKKILIGGGVVSKSLGDNENMLQLFMLSLFILGEPTFPSSIMFCVFKAFSSFIT